MSPEKPVEGQARTTRPAIRKAILAGAAVVVGLVFALILAECLLRIWDLPRHYLPHSIPDQFLILKDQTSGRLFHINTPKSTIRFVYDGNPRGYFDAHNAVEHPTNSDGFRGPELSEAKPQRTLRLLFLGDSFTFGEGVRFDDTFVQRTGKLLDERFAKDDVRFECVNLGVGGYNTADELSMLQRVGARLRPDAVVLCYVLNDAEPPLFHIDAEGNPVRRSREAQIAEGLATAKPPDGLFYRSRLAQLVHRFLSERRRGRQTEDYYRALYRPDSPDWQSTQRALDEIGDYCREKKIPLYVMVFPILHRLDESHPFQNLYTAVLDRARQHGARTINLLPALAGHSAESLWVHPTDQHPNEVAHRIAAEKLAEALGNDPDFRNKAAADKLSP